MVWPHGIIMLKQCLNNCSCWPARASSYVTELHLPFLRTCNSWSPTTDTAFINSSDIAYILNRLWQFVPNSFSTTRNSVTAHSLKTHITISHHSDNTLYMVVKTHGSAELQYSETGHSKLGTEKCQCCWFWPTYRKCYKTFWAILIIWLKWHMPTV